MAVSDGLIVKAKIMKNWNGQSPQYVNDRHIHVPAYLHTLINSIVFLYLNNVTSTAILETSFFKIRASKTKTYPDEVFARCG